ncbi:hypothetical protein SAMN05444354_101303 [Stigmatella aurantiaca]|uniref:Uncharacterized protein n=1 Tax=Stigmatella aurantiaca TaxID=41 RepID=A0A1H7G4G1_STIAU|nr:MULTISPECIES: hypothetical protein [Stigmatella]SEK33021.1 hypothetical protein SAMN05444354_101303 [Stigmatella aurantiaca]
MNDTSPQETASGRFRIRRADRLRAQRVKRSYAVFRFWLYGMVGIFAEIFFYNFVRIARNVPLLEALVRFRWQVDERLPLNDIWDTPAIAAYGQCSLWMFAVYGIASLYFIEPAFRRLVRQHLLVRAAVYGVIILLFEGVSGMLLHGLTGYRIWYYADAGAILWGMTSLYILPIWMVTGLLTERIYRELMDPALLEAFESPLPSTEEETEASFQLIR